MSWDSRVEDPNAGCLYLIEMQFTTGTVRATNWNHNLEWMGHTWLGYQAIVSLSSLVDSDGIAYPSVDLGLRISNPGMLALARGNVGTYRRRPVLIWMGLLDEQLRVDGEPVLAWSGLMDQVRIKTGDGRDPGIALMRCELHGRDGRAPQTLRINHAQQQARYPGDTGLARMEQLIGKPTQWLSKRFQQR